MSVKLSHQVFYFELERRYIDERMQMQIMRVLWHICP